jgi:hypothetical protein
VPPIHPPPSASPPTLLSKRPKSAVTPRRPLQRAECAALDELSAVRAGGGEGAQLPTQLYIAYGYTSATLVLFIQHLVYNHVLGMPEELGELDQRLLHSGVRARLPPPCLREGQ